MNEPSPQKPLPEPERTDARPADGLRPAATPAPAERQSRNSPGPATASTDATAIAPHMPDKPESAERSGTREYPLVSEADTTRKKRPTGQDSSPKDGRGEGSRNWDAPLEYGEFEAKLFSGGGVGPHDGGDTAHRMPGQHSTTERAPSASEETRGSTPPNQQLGVKRVRDANDDEPRKRHESEFTNEGSPRQTDESSRHSTEGASEGASEAARDLLELENARIEARKRQQKIGENDWEAQQMFQEEQERMRKQWHEAKAERKRELAEKRAQSQKEREEKEKAMFAQEQEGMMTFRLPSPPSSRKSSTSPAAAGTDGGYKRLAEALDAAKAQNGVPVDISKGAASNNAARSQNTALPSCSAAPTTPTIPAPPQGEENEAAGSRKVLVPSIAPPPPPGPHAQQTTPDGPVTPSAPSQLPPTPQTAGTAGPAVVHSPALPPDLRQRHAQYQQALNGPQFQPVRPEAKAGGPRQFYQVEIPPHGLLPPGPPFQGPPVPLPPGHALPPYAVPPNALPPGPPPAPGHLVSGPPMPPAPPSGSVSAAPAISSPPGPPAQDPAATPRCPSGPTTGVLVPGPPPPVHHPPPGAVIMPPIPPSLPGPPPPVPVPPIPDHLPMPVPPPWANYAQIPPPAPPVYRAAWIDRLSAPPPAVGTLLAPPAPSEPPHGLPMGSEEIPLIRPLNLPDPDVPSNTWAPKLSIGSEIDTRQWGVVIRPAPIDLEAEIDFAVRKRGPVRRFDAHGNPYSSRKARRCPGCGREYRRYEHIRRHRCDEEEETEESKRQKERVKKREGRKVSCAPSYLKGLRPRTGMPKEWEQEVEAWEKEHVWQSFEAFRSVPRTEDEIAYWRRTRAKFAWVCTDVGGNGQPPAGPPAGPVVPAPVSVPSVPAPVGQYRNTTPTSYEKKKAAKTVAADAA